MLQHVEVTLKWSTAIGELPWFIYAGMAPARSTSSQQATQHFTAEGKYSWQPVMQQNPAAAGHKQPLSSPPYYPTVNATSFAAYSEWGCGDRERRGIAAVRISVYAQMLLVILVEPEGIVPKV